LTYFTYYPKKIQITASVLDVGYIKHSKQVETWTYKGLYKYEGLILFLMTAMTLGTYNEFNDAIPLDSIYTKYTTWRPQKLNASYQYSFNQRW
jgi:hypothetical protein